MSLGAPTVVATATPVATAGISSTAFTPVAGRLYIVYSANTGNAAANAQGTITSSWGSSVAWTPIGSGVFGGATSGGARGWWMIAPAGLTSGTVTVTLPSTPTIQDLFVEERTGADPTTPIVGVATATGTTETTLSAAVGSTPTIADQKVGFVVNRNKTTAPTPGASGGWLTVRSAASATPSASLLVEAKGGDTGTTVDVANIGTTWSGLIAFVVKAAAVTGYEAVVLADGPLGYWRTGESSGTTMNDASGYLHSGVYNAMTLGTAGMTGDGDTAVTTTGTTSYGKVTGAAWMNTAAWTVETWVKFAAGPTFRMISREAGPGQSVNPDYVWSIQISSSAGVPEAVVFDSGGNVQRVSGNRGVGDNRWHHVVISYDGTTAKTYVDGMLGGSLAVTGVYRSNLTDIVLANVRQTSGADLVFAPTGLSLDEVAFYGTALSATRVKAHFNAGVEAIRKATATTSAYATSVLADTPLAYWKLGDDGTIAALADSSGNGRHLPIYGTPTFGQPKKAPYLDGTSIAVAGGNEDGDGGFLPAADATWFSSLTGTFTYEAWTRSPSSYSTIASIYNSSYAPDGQHHHSYIRMNGGGNFEFGAASASAGLSIQSPANIASNTVAHHVVATYNAGTVKLYVDGVLVATGSGFPVPGSGVTGGTPLRIGAGSYTATSVPYAAFNGELQHIALYDKELSATRVSAHYTAATTPPSNSTINATAADTTTVSDSTTRVRTLTQGVADTTALSDSVTTGHTLGRSGSDPVTGGDSATRALMANRTPAEAVTGADNLTKAVLGARTGTEVTTVTDVPARALATLRSAADATATLDALATAMGLVRGAADTTAVTETPATAVTSGRLGSEAVPTADTATRLLAVSRDGVEMTHTDDVLSAPAARSRAAADAVLGVDAADAASTSLRAVADTAPATDVVTRTAGKYRTADDAAPALDAASRTLIRVRRGFSFLSLLQQPTGQVITSIAGFPEVTDVTLSSTRVGPDLTATLTFSFSIPVTGWSVRRDAHDATSGTELVSWYGPDPVTGASITIDANDLMPGVNDVSIYGYASGRWTDGYR